MAQALENILDNAIKYTPAKGRIELSCTVSEGFAVLEIADTGPGVSSDLLPKLFERFYRAPETQGLAEGTGLGLLIVRKVVEGHGGRVSARSDGVLGQGTVFSLHLPL